ncbi:unnamed protein product, partial [Didymodactylos carnosus]
MECNNIDTVIDELINKVASYQVLKPRNYTPPAIWKEDLGLYRSEMRFSFHGNEIEAELRKNKYMYVYDNNMFSTA